MRTVRYRVIADALRERALVAPAGSVLPSESELSKEFGASRVTIRRALNVLRGKGLIAARQGFGWYVAGPRVRQRIADFRPVGSQLAARGMTSERRVMEFGFLTPPDHVQDLFGASEAEPGSVLRVKQVNFADGDPFEVVVVWCPNSLSCEWSRAQVERESFYSLLGIPLGGATQTIGADAATEDDAMLLHVPVGAPLLTCQRVTTSVDGAPVLVSEHRLPAHRSEFVVEVTSPEPSTLERGLRLLE